MGQKKMQKVIEKYCNIAVSHLQSQFEFAFKSTFLATSVHSQSLAVGTRLWPHIHPPMPFVLQGMSLVWESYKLDPYVQRLAECVFSFQEKVSELPSISNFVTMFFANIL